MAVTSWLIDKSAYGGSNSAKQQTVTRLEPGYSARSGDMGVDR